MTEEAWLTATVPRPMLDIVCTRFSDRKLRLFSCACCDRFCVRERARGRTDLAKLSADLIAVAEAYCDRPAEWEERRAAVEHDRYPTPAQCTTRSRMASRVSETADISVVAYCVQKAAWEVAHLLHPVHHQGGSFSFAMASIRRNKTPEYLRTLAEEQAFQCRLAFDIFGNPFRPAAVDPSWLTSDVVLLATGVYEERAFDRLPILADALQDAGCDSDDLLNHLRDPNATHVRGCWALDLVLGKA